MKTSLSILIHMVKGITRILCFIMIMIGLAGIPEVFPAVQAGGGFFEKGKIRLSVLGSSGRSLDQNYLILGVGAGYFVAKGLELGLNVDTWLGNDPSIYEVTPVIRYVLDLKKPLYPYVGAFYTRSIYEDLEDLDAAGFRAGVFSSIGPRTLIGLGMVYDRLLDCDEDIYESCTEVYSEAMLSFTF